MDDIENKYAERRVSYQPSTSHSPIVWQIVYNIDLIVFIVCCSPRMKDINSMQLDHDEMSIAYNVRLKRMCLPD